MTRLIGISRAKELIYTGRTIDGEEAYGIGLVNHSVKQNDSGDAAYKRGLSLAEEISQNVNNLFNNFCCLITCFSLFFIMLPFKTNKGPVAIQMAKLSIDSGIEVDLQSALKFEELCYSRVIPTKDRVEGLNAFKEKRPPKYIGE